MDFTRVRKTMLAAGLSLAMIAGATSVAAVDSSGGGERADDRASAVADVGERLPGYPFPAISSVAR